MSIKEEKERAIEKTREFLRSLLDRKATPRIPLAIRRQAYSCLKHFPWEGDILIREDITGKFKLPKKSKD